MKQIRVLAQYYVDLMVKLGLVRFSILLAGYSSYRSADGGDYAAARRGGKH